MICGCGCGREVFVRSKELYKFKRMIDKNMVYYYSWSCYNKDRPESENCTCVDCIIGYRCSELKRKRRDENEEFENTEEQEIV